MKVILIRGLAASGKTTFLNKIISTGLKVDIWIKDDIFDKFLEKGVEWDKANRLSYENLFEVLFKKDFSSDIFLIDAPYYRINEYNSLKDFCLNQSYEFKSVLVVCSDKSEWKKRLEERSQNPLPNQKITNYDDMKKYYGSMEIEPFSDEYVFDSCNTFEMKDLLNFIKK